MSLTDIAKAFYSSAEASALRPAEQTATALVSDAYGASLRPRRRCRRPQLLDRGT